MAEHASTDDIVKMAYESCKTHWKEFIGFPILISLLFGLMFGAVFYLVFAISHLTIGLLPFLYLLMIVFWITYLGAQVKWCEEIYKGRKNIDLQKGLSYGLSRFWGTLGTYLLTGIKILLWMLLLILPGYYKALMYSKSVHVSILEKKSGGDANRISEAIVKKAGPIRTLSNLFGVGILGEIILALVWLASLILSGVLSYMNDSLGIIISGIIMTISIAFILSLIFVYFHFEYLYFRDEAKKEVNKLKKALS